MRKVFLPVLLFACVGAFAQNDSTTNDILTTRRFRKGVFVNYTEFKSNSPSVESGFSIAADTGLYDRYTIRFDKKKNKVRNVFALSDGVDLYLNSAGSNPSSYFVKIVFLGPITYFEDNRRKDTSPGARDPNNPGRMLFLPDEDGETYILDRTNLISILKENDLEMLKRFKSEKGNDTLDVLLRYVIEFNERSLNKK